LTKMVAMTDPLVHGTQATTTLKERQDYGREARKRVPPSALAELVPRERTALEILHEQDADRLTDLVPLRYKRMRQSDFAFLRGAPAVMAYDLSRTPQTDCWVQLCGDAHLLNFGLFATPERRMVFDLNDFDETLRGPFEWDVKRLVASVYVATQAGHGKPDTMVKAALDSYRQHIHEAAVGSPIQNYYTRLDAGTLMDDLRGRDRRVAKASARAAAEHTHLSALRKLTVLIEGRIRLRERPPLIVRGDEDAVVMEVVKEVMGQYRETLAPPHQRVLDHYRPVDIARKVVGVGSVGTHCYVILMLSPDNHPLFIQVKEAQPSVLEPYLGASALTPGERVVRGQRLLQTTSDILLGHAEGPGGRSFYFRQMWDSKFSYRVTRMTPRHLRMYCRGVGAMLARDHARTGDPAIIDGYIGHEFTVAMRRWARRYAAITTSDRNQMKDSPPPAAEGGAS